MSCVSNLYFDDATTIFCNSSRTKSITPFEFGCVYGASSNLQDQISNNLSTLTNSVNLSIRSTTLTIALS